MTPRLIDTRPGEILSLSFRVTSRAAAEELFVEDLKLPANWQPLLPTGTFPLRPGDVQARVVALAVPKTTPAGRYDVTYSVRSQRDYGLRDADTVSVAVLPASKLVLLLDQAPSAVIAGEQYQARVRVLNQGNAPLRVKLSAVRDDQHLVPVEPPRLDLASGASGVAALTIKTDKDELRPRKQFVFVTAEGELGAGKAMKTVLTIGVDLIPRVTGKVDLRHRIPTTLALLGLSERGSGVQAELAGHGPLDEEGTRYLDFLFRAPDLQDKSIYGLRDEFRLGYATREMDVLLGDQSYGLSRLTDYYRYGRGLGFDLHRPGEPDVGAYYLRTRWQSPGHEEIGAHLGSRFGDRVSARINYLYRRGFASPTVSEFHDQLWSLEAKVRPRDDMNLRLEFARGDTSRTPGARDSAYDICLDGRFGRGGYYSLSRTHAGPDYYGYYHDSDYADAAVTVPLSRRLQAHASLQNWKQNLALRPTQTTAPREDLRQIGATYSFGEDWYLTADFDDFSSRDALLPADFDFREQDVRVAVGRAAEKYNLRAEVRAGRQEDRLTGQSQHVRRYSLYGTYRPGPSQFLTLYGGLGDDNTISGSRFLGDSNNLGASFTWLPSDDLLVRFGYLKYGFGSDDRTASGQFEFHAAYRESEDRSWVLDVRRNSPGFEGQSETSVALAYVYSFGLPVSQKKTVGAVNGRVYDAQKPGKPGVADVVVLVSGATAVTDRDGRFVFPALPPGTHQLRLAEGAFGFKRVPVRKLPMPVEVVVGKVQEVDVGVVDAAGLSGTVTLVAGAGEGGATIAEKSGAAYVVGAPAAVANVPKPGGMREILVELTDGDEIVRGTTDFRGEFRFDGLRPGNWRLKAYDCNLPAYHQFERPETALELKPGEVGKVALRVMPSLRHIRMLEDQVQPISTNTPAP